MSESSEDEMEVVEVKSLPQKKYYRQRAHSNPAADHTFTYPVQPSEMNWNELYPKYFTPGEEGKKKVEFLDVGCGYGGLLMKLSTEFPETLSLGMEIRMKVCDYVKDKIDALRTQHIGEYQNVACIRTNVMKYIFNYIEKWQLTKMFFLYPDPHFKKRKHKWRIVSRRMLDQYAFVLAPGGILYTVTDVEELHVWMVKETTEHPLFKRLTDSEMEGDPILNFILDISEEGCKVTRNSGSKFLAVFKRIKSPPRE